MFFFDESMRLIVIYFASLCSNSYFKSVGLNVEISNVKTYTINVDVDMHTEMLDVVGVSNDRIY